jgi:hypothetical protein
LNRAAVKDRGRRLGVPADGEAEKGTEIMDDGLETADRGPASALLVNHLPGREVLGQVAPRRTGACDPVQAVEDIAEVRYPLAGVLGKQTKIGDQEGPFGIRNIAGVWLVSDHTLRRILN